MLSQWSVYSWDRLVLPRLHLCDLAPESPVTLVPHVLSPGTLSLFLVPMSGCLLPQGTTYQKTDAAVEMKRINREQFWEQAKVSSVDFEPPGPAVST